MQETVRGRSGVTVRQYCSGGVVPMGANPAAVNSIFEGSRKAIPLNANQIELSLHGDTAAGDQSQAGKENLGGGLQSVDFLIDLYDSVDITSQEYLKLVKKFKRLLDINDVKAIYDLEDTR